MSSLMSNLKVGQEDLKEMESLPYKVEERLIQVEGNFYKWDPALGQNLLIAGEIFLSIDRVTSSSAMGGQYIINVHDKKGLVSFTVCEISSDQQF